MEAGRTGTDGSADRGREAVGLLQISDIKKNNDYAMWLKVCRKADLWLLDECLAKYRRGRVGSISTHGYKTLIKWHYKLWHQTEGKAAVASPFCYPDFTEFADVVASSGVKRVRFVEWELIA